MIHYVLLKFLPGAFTQDIYDLAVRTFAQLKDAGVGILDAAVEQNCVVRDANADLMVRLTLRSEADLPVYLKHPLHVAFAEATTPLMAARMSFDHH